MTEYELYQDVFIEMFPREIKRYIETHYGTLEEAKARADEANARADEAERLLCESTREWICETLESRRWFEEVPQDLINRLNNVANYSLLKDVLTAAKKAENYDAFQKSFEGLLANSL